MDRDKELTESWNRNAGNWIRAVRGGRIPSRRAGTDQAILDAVSRAAAGRAPGRLLDVGCGEGWLLRRLADRADIAGVGIDASAPLIAAARRADPVSRYEVVSYAELIAGTDRLGDSFDVIVFNFALFEEDVVSMLEAARARLAEGGAIVIQTPHPDAAAPGGDRRDGWRVENFAAFEHQDWAPMPWYFRTLESWQEAIRRAGLTLQELRQPAAGPDQAPLSLLMVCAAAL